MSTFQRICDWVLARFPWLALRTAPVGHPQILPTLIHQGNATGEERIAPWKLGCGAECDAALTNAERNVIVDSLIVGCEVSNWKLDLSDIPADDLPNAPSGEFYDGMFMKCGRVNMLDNQRVVYFHLSHWGICGGWSGYAVLKEDGAYESVQYDFSTVADTCLVDPEIKIDMPEMSATERKNLQTFAWRFDQFLRLVLKGHKVPLELHQMP